MIEDNAKSKKGGWLADFISSSAVAVASKSVAVAIISFRQTVALFGEDKGT